ncbi:MAG: hypothetical protein NZL99_04310 [Burkholderiaceae bacterium]|nr:hypothetical protein [Burkholderiaceae bacterium]
MPGGETGRFLPWDNPFDRVRGTLVQGGIGSAQAHAWDARLRAIVEFLKAMPALAQPQGFYPEFVGHIDVLRVGRFVDKPKQAPLVGGVALWAWPPRDITRGADGQLRLVKGAHNISFRLELNYVYPPRADPWMRDAQGEFGPLQRHGDFAGFPLIGNDLVITRDGRLPFAPVSQERALTAFIDWHTAHTLAAEKEHAAQRARAYEDFVSPAGRARRLSEIDKAVAAAHPSRAQQVRAQLEAIDRRREQDLLAEARKEPGPITAAVEQAKSRLRSMSAAERTAAAWLRPSRGQQALEIVAAETPGAWPLVAFDPSFFDPRQPRDTLRVALVREVHIIAEGARRGAFPQTLYLHLLQQIDWRAFAERFLM